MKKSESNSKSQGNNNGPDFIFNDNLTNDKIGIEITSNGRNEYSVDIRKKDKKEEILNDIYKKNTRFGDPNFEINLKTFLNIVKKIIDEKCIKAKNYVKCKKLYLVVVFESNRILPYFRECAEMIINNNKDFNKTFTYIFIK